ncbi:MAG: hypothetical protein AAGA54_25300 [Myxococcota bacterium]
MTRSAPLPRSLLFWAAFASLGCNDGGTTTPSAGSSSGDGSSGTTAPVTASATTAATAPGTGTTTEAEDATTFADTDDNTQGAKCNIYAQDCPMNEKCAPWSDQADLIPDEIRCCPIVGENPREAGDTCTVEGYLGSCVDDCQTGTFCLDIDGDGEGVCQPLCSGSVTNPECDIDETCFIYFEGVPMCFPTCDPLAQNCPDTQGCYPDEQEAGGTGFICLPTIGSTGDYNEFCFLLSACLPGFICVTADFLPECNSPLGCCTPLCDTGEEDTCSQFHEDLQCVSWYFDGQTPPSASLADVGACAQPM